MAKPPPPRLATRGALAIVAVVAAIIVSIFVGYNIYHWQTLQERQSGQVDPREGPKTPTDLQGARVPKQ